MDVESYTNKSVQLNSAGYDRLNGDAFILQKDTYGLKPSKTEWLQQVFSCETVYAGLWTFY